MRKQVITILFLCVSIVTFAQINFEKGYYIDNSGAKIDCYIKNVDWKNNPTEFQYKLSENGEKQTTTIKKVQAFEIYNAAKYERFTVAIDVSYQNLNDLESSDQPRWETQQLFLKTLIEGEASLYSYINGNLRKYFIKSNNVDVQQLVYKKYMATESRIGENNQFRRQLWDALDCGDLRKKIKNANYTKSSLIKFFKLYNDCKGTGIVNYEARIKRDRFNISIKPGVNFASADVKSNFAPSYELNFEEKTGFQFGVEAEFILNFNRNKWAIVIEPTYISYSGEQEFIYLQTTSATRTTNAIIDYSGVEIPLGIRHYSFINDSSKLFFNALYMFNITLNDELYAEQREILDTKISPKGNLAFGIGYKYDNKYSVEFRYKTPRELLPNNPFLTTKDYSSFAIIFGYTLF
ncbi:MAG: tRNA modification GTPase [Kordia sp.]|uniref:tRNA modification GTPase n=1 Tax=Kordia sp. TaxID=1965332 RepID=UPI0038589052